QQIGVVLRVAVEAGWRGTRKYPPVVFVTEETGRHRRAGTHHRRIEHPALGPTRLQALSGDREIGRCGADIVFRIAGHMTLQARPALAAEKGASHGFFLVGDRLQLLGDERGGLRRERLEEAHDLTNLAVREAEGGHSYL